MMPAEVQARAKRKKELVKIVKAGLTSFISTGQALIELRRDEHYLGTHKNFPAFCKDEFGISKSRAHQLMASSHGGRVMSTIVDGTNYQEEGVPESHARVLGDVEDETEIAKIVHVAAEIAEDEGKPLSARHLQEAKDQVVDEPANDTESNEEDPEEEEEEEPEDDFPEGWLQIEMRADPFREMLNHLTAVSKLVNGVLTEEARGFWLTRHQGDLKRLLKDARSRIKAEMPEMDCYVCDDPQRPDANCVKCEGCGYVNAATVRDDKSGTRTIESVAKRLRSER